MTRPLSQMQLASATPASPPLYVAGIGVGLAPTSQTVSEAAEDLQLDAGAQKMFSRLFGFATLPYEKDAPFRTLLQTAVNDLARTWPDLVAVNRVYHCHTLPSVRLPDTPLTAECGPATEVSSLGMAHCATGVAAFKLLEHCLKPQETALVLIGERAFHRRIRLIDDTTIMGEGAVALAVTRGKGALRVLGSHVTHDGCAARSRGHPLEPPQVGRDYTSFVAEHLTSAMSRFGISVDCPPDLVLPHNVNMVSWHPIAKAVGLSPKSFYLRNVGRIAHCFGADPFLNLLDAQKDGLARPGQTVLLTSVGMGLSAASLLLRIEGTFSPSFQASYE